MAPPPGLASPALTRSAPGVSTATPRGRRCLVVTGLLTSHAALFGLGYHWHSAFSRFQAHQQHDLAAAGPSGISSTPVGLLHTGTPVTHASGGRDGQDQTRSSIVPTAAVIQSTPPPYPPPPLPPPPSPPPPPFPPPPAVSASGEKQQAAVATPVVVEESDEEVTEEEGLLALGDEDDLTTDELDDDDDQGFLDTDDSEFLDDTEEDETDSTLTDITDNAIAAAVPAAVSTPASSNRPGSVVDLGSGSDGEWVGRLTSSNIAKPGDVVIYTWTNFHMRDFLVSFLLSLHGHGLRTFVIGALDDELAQFLSTHIAGDQGLRGATVPVLRLNAGLTKADYGWNSPAFKKMARYKFESVLRLMEAGYHVCVADTDTAWLRNPLPLFASISEPDVLISTDVLRRMPLREQVHSTLNIGVMLFRATPPCVKFVRAFFDDMVGDPNFGTDRAEWDQARFNRMARDGGVRYGPDGTDYMLAWRGTVKLQALDIVDFPNGHVFFVQRLPQQLGREAYIAHATFQYGGTAGKRHRFREARVWRGDPDDYYAPKGGLLEYEFVPDAKLVAAGNSSIDAHFALMNPQLSALRSAWGLARALGRTLVLPPFLCGQDRAWFPHDGVFPGSDPIFTIPWSPCPADHVLDVEALDKLGEMQRLREWSLLNNTRMPKASLDGAVWVDWLPDRSPDSPLPKEDPKLVGEDGTLFMPTRVKASTVREVLAHTAGVPVLRFKGMPGTGAASAFAGFDDAKEQREFTQLLTAAPAFWCCIDAARAQQRGQPFPPGQTWYDLQWDLGEHTDRFNRKWGAEWSIKLGP